MGNSASTAKNGMGLGTFVFLTLLILKATGNIAMGWFWVISSIIWAPLVIGIMLLILLGIIGIIAVALGLN